MELRSQPLAEPERPQAKARRRGTACERCNRRRTKCDGWINGVPCSGCRQSNNHANCALIRSKRRRGPDGRYRNDSDASQGPGITAGSTSDGVSTQGNLRADGMGNPSGRLNPRSSADATMVAGRTREPPTPRHEARSSCQPSLVGESWYASYFMRGYAPGSTNSHHPIDHCEETVQSISRDTPEQTHRLASPPRGTKMSDLPDRDSMNRLVQAYFTRFHAFCPIIERSSFIASFSAGSISCTLLRSVLFVASLHCDLDILHLMGHSTRINANADLFAKASASFNEDAESDRINMVLSSYLLHYWFGNPTTYRDAHWWLAAAIRSAQCMGYNRSTKNSQLPPQEKSRWKRIWWCLYIRDRQTALSTGSPMVINDLDQDVEELAREDLPEETPETVNYVLSQMELNKTAAQLYFLHCSPSRLSLSADPSVRQTALQDVQTTLQEWYNTSEGLLDLPKDHHLQLTAKVCYYYYLINLHQRVQRQCSQPSDGKLVLNAAACIFSLVEDSLLHWSPEHFPMIYVSALFSAMIALAADSSASFANSEQLRGRIRSGLLALKAFEPMYKLARWIRNYFMGILRRSEAHDQTSARDHNATPETGSQAPTGTSTARSPMASNQYHHSTPDVAMEKLTFSFVGDGAPLGLWPTSLSSGGFPSSHDADLMDFPQPDSLQYQTMSFLADLGIASSDFAQIYH